MTAPHSRATPRYVRSRVGARGLRGGTHGVEPRTRTYDGAREGGRMRDHAGNAGHRDGASRPGEYSWPGDLTTIETEFGEFAAVDDGEITRIRNIRYARAERFAPPIPVDPDPHEASARQYQRLGCPQPPAASD